MPIGVVLDDEFNAELERLNSSIQKVVPSPTLPKVEVLDRPGRSLGDNNVPDSLRQIIGEDAVINGRQSALSLAKDFDISPSSVSAYAKGATSTTTYDSPSQSIISHINKSRARAIKKAGRTLNSALAAITQEKLDYADAGDLSGIAKDMSVIIKNLEPEKVSDETRSQTSPQFIIYAPQFKREESFEVIHVKE